MPPGTDRRENNLKKTNTTENNAPQLTMRIGKTTYVIGMCFKEDAKETMDDKVRKMIREEVKK